MSSEGFFLETELHSFIHREHGYNRCPQYPTEPVVIQATTPSIYHGIANLAHSCPSLLQVLLENTNEKHNKTPRLQHRFAVAAAQLHSYMV